MLGKYLKQVRTKAPLIHNITNYVTVNDVANVLLACGGSRLCLTNRQILLILLLYEMG